MGAPGISHGGARPCAHSGLGGWARTGSGVRTHLGFVSSAVRAMEGMEGMGAGVWGSALWSQSPLLRGPAGGTAIWVGGGVPARETEGRRRNSETGRTGCRAPMPAAGWAFEELRACAGKAGPGSPCPGWPPESPSSPGASASQPSSGRLGETRVG